MRKNVYIPFYCTFQMKARTKTLMITGTKACQIFFLFFLWVTVNAVCKRTSASLETLALDTYYCNVPFSNLQQIDGKNRILKKCFQNKNGMLRTKKNIFFFFSFFNTFFSGKWKQICLGKREKLSTPFCVKKLLVPKEVKKKNSTPPFQFNKETFFFRERATTAASI